MNLELMSRRDVLFARIDVLSWRLQQDEDTDPARLLAATEEAMEIAPMLGEEDCLLLVERIERAQEAVKASQQRLARRMESLPAERRALRGYVSHSSVRNPVGHISRRV
jgi:thioesterase domain-containing protein